jgi:response regulator of citrate/malate metabolism
VSNENGQPDFDTIVLSLRAIQKEIQGRVSAKQAELDEILVEKRKIDQMLAAATRTGHYAAKNKTTKTKGIGGETVEVAWQKLQAAKPEDFTAQDLALIAGVEKSTAQKLVAELRGQNRIRLVGQRTRDSGTGRASRLYVISG